MNNGPLTVQGPIILTQTSPSSSTTGNISLVSGGLTVQDTGLYVSNNGFTVSSGSLSASSVDISNRGLYMFGSLNISSKLHVTGGMSILGDSSSYLSITRGSVRVYNGSIIVGGGVSVAGHMTIGGGLLVTQGMNISGIDGKSNVDTIALIVDN